MTLNTMFTTTVKLKTKFASLVDYQFSQLQNTKEQQKSNVTSDTGHKCKTIVYVQTVHKNFYASLTANQGCET